ncbi:MAG TPA: DNA translocase FtsK [Tenuifilaceae bacterium]|nr:DNA translocase FtsK [Tenuifilaceae bacterium]HPJ44457.1 DNA translocase FtsK [Tenuifilaceae bacterium]
MAKQNTKVNGKGNQIKGKRNIFRDERVRFTLGVFTLFLAVYIAVAFLSYFFTWRIDQSFEWLNVFSDSSVRVENWAGKVGASFASQFINRWFGISSFVVPFFIFIVGARLLKIRLLPLRKTFLRSILGMVLLSILLGFLFSDANGYLGSGLGGAHGLFVSQWLIAFIGKAGTAFLLLITIVAYLIYISATFHFWITKVMFAAISNIKTLFKHEEKVVTPNVENPEVIITEEKEKVSHDFSAEDESSESEEAVNPKELESFEVRTFPENDIELEQEDNDELEVFQTQTNQQGAEKEKDIEMTVEKMKEEEVSEAKNTETDFYDPTLELSTYQRPPIELLEDYKNRQAPVSDEELHENKNRIVETLANYKIEIARILATVGPTVTLYEIVPAPGVRISKIKNLEDDIALSLSALGIRIIAPIPGRGTIGIEVPNQHPEVVSMFSILRSVKFQESKFDLAIALGKTISNETYVIDLAKMPHLLVAGATGQGKSVGLNAIIASLLYKKHPAQLKFVFVDPKKVELTLYSKLERHFLAKLPDTEEAIITDTQKVINTLNSLCIEMDSRYDLLKAAHVRNIKEYNEKFIARRLNPNKGHKYLPYIVVIIDEFADLIMTAGREIETPIARLAQLARAIGIHLIIATQRPTTNIITGVIKANFPARIAFRVSSMIDSRTILDTPGANQLIGKGDMLVSTGNDLVRVQCAFVDTPEIERITDFIGNQKGYATAFELPEYVGETSDESADIDLQKRDDLFEDAARIVIMNQQGSTSLIQRKLSIGYNRAGRIIDQLEAAGVVGPFEGSKARQVLIQDEMSLEQILRNIDESASLQ